MCYCKRYSNPEDSSSKAEAAADVSAAPSQTAKGSPQSSAEAALWTKLIEADEETYVVLLRHALAPGTGDPANFQLDDCSTQRNLSEAGRQQARDIGEAFRDRNIPVTQVLSSQWCQCLETAAYSHDFGNSDVCFGTPLEMKR